jgi:phage-related protein
VAAGSPLATAFVRIRPDTAGFGRALKQQVARDTDAENIGRALSRSLDRGIDLKQFSTFAQKLRDIRTICNATLAPIKSFSGQVAKLAVVAGAASTGLLAGGGLAGGALALAGALAQVGGAAPVAASGLASLAAVFATVKLATLGVGDGITEVVKANAALAAGQKLTKAQTEKLAASLKGLAPNARGFVLQISALLPALRKMQQGIQQLFFARLAGQLKELGERFIPVLTKAGYKLAIVLGDTVYGAMQRLNTATAQWNLASVLNDAAQAVQGLAPAMARIPALLIDIAASAGPAFRGLAADASRALSGLVDKLQAAVNSGALAKGINTGIAALKSLGSIAHSVFSALHSLVTGATAVIGGNMLRAISDVAQKFAAFLKSAGGQETLRAVFAAALPVLARLGGLLQVVGPALADLAPVILRLADAFLTGLKPVIPVAAALAKTLGEALAAVLPSVSAFAVALGSSLVAAVNLLKPIIPPLAAALATLLSPTGALQALFAAIAPILAPLTQGLANVVSILGGGLVTAFNTLAPTLPALARAITAVAAALSKALVDALIAVLPQLPTLIASLTQLLVAVTPLIPVFAAVAGPLLRLGGLFIAFATPVAIFTGLLNSLRVAGQQMTAPLSTAFNVVKAAVVGFVAVAGARIAGLIGTFAAVPGRVGRALSALPGQVGAAFSAAMRLGVQAVVLGIGTVIGYARGIPGRVAGAVGNLGGVLFGAGASLIRGLIDGIQSMFSALASKLSQITSMIPKLKGPPVRDRRLLAPAGRSIMAGLVGGIESGRVDLARTLAGVTRQINVGGAAGMGGPAGGVVDAAGVGAEVAHALAGASFVMDRDGVVRWVAAGLGNTLAVGGRA